MEKEDQLKSSPFQLYMTGSKRSHEGSNSLSSTSNIDVSDSSRIQISGDHLTTKEVQFA